MTNPSFISPALQRIMAVVSVGVLVGCSTENDPNGPAWTRLRCDVQMYGSTLPMLISYRDRPPRARWNDKLLYDVEVGAAGVTARDGSASLKIERATNQLTIHLGATERGGTRLSERDLRGMCATIARRDISLIERDEKKALGELFDLPK